MSETWNYDLKDPLDQNSVQILFAHWPEIETKEHDWNGNGVIEKPADGGDSVLEGDQCLVFFLGGIKQTGFSVNPKRPTLSRGERMPCFYELPAYRLLQNGNAASKHGFPSLRDPFGKNFYAYFSSNRRTNGYNQYAESDCATLGVWPYAKALVPVPLYYNPDSFQIISAGENQRFGLGTKLPESTPWTPETLQKLYPPGSPGADDLANFYDLRLGNRD